MNPAVSEKDLGDFYGDSLAHYSLDYMYEKRINFIMKHDFQADLYIEIGANSQSIFHKELKKKFQTVKTMDINVNVDVDSNSMDNISTEKANIIAHYFVLEHIVNPQVFLQECYESLHDEGIMIIEVPDLEDYDKDISALKLFEHMQHFTKDSLEYLCNNSGFEMINYSKEDCSRSYGFVASFKKTNKNKKLLLNNNYLKNKSLVLDGIKHINTFNESIKKMHEFINNEKNKNFLLWGVNQNFLDLIA